MGNEAHAFIVEEAVEYGVEKAILLQHIRFWCNQNKNKDTHYHDGKVWMYQSVSDMRKHYPYWSGQKIGRLLRDMESNRLIISGNFNKIGYDQTKWYSLNVQCSDLNNGELKMNNLYQILNQILKHILCLKSVGLCIIVKGVNKSLLDIGLSYLKKIG